MGPSTGSDLVPLPQQPAGVPWPAHDWPEAARPRVIDPLLDEAFAEGSPIAETLAVVIVHGGSVVAERYGHGCDATTPLLSWSMAKSVLHAAVGLLVGDGLLRPDQAAPVPRWSAPGDPRGAITIEHLLTMRDGLRFAEDYVDEQASDVIPMLFGEGKGDVAAFAADRPLAHAPGEHFSYSSGTSNILSRIVGDVVSGGADGYRAWLHERLFDAIGMASASPRFDEAGTFIASSFLYATARDFARFGLLYLRDGVWADGRVLPEGWVDHGRRIRSRDPDDGRFYGAHWWVVGDRLGTFWANGYEGQSITVVPGLDAVIVRLGKTPKARYPDLFHWRGRLIEALAG